jgi:hypothetical protein
MMRACKPRHVNAPRASGEDLGFGDLAIPPQKTSDDFGHECALLVKFYQIVSPDKMIYIAKA